MLACHVLLTTRIVSVFMKPKAYHISIISGVFLIFMVFLIFVVEAILHLLCFDSSFVHQHSCYKYNNF